MPLRDGRLSHDIDPSDRAPQDACGVFGVWVPADQASRAEVSKLTYYGLYALQHRGQESAGIAVSDGSRIVVFKDMGLVAQVFDESVLNTLRGHIAVGHCRYSTTGSPTWENAQPTFRSTDAGGLALVHNGNLINTPELAARLEPGVLTATSDTEVLTALLAEQGKRGAGGAPDGTAGPLAAAREILPATRGAYSLVFMDEGTLYAARDPEGVRPLVLGALEDRGWVVASETAGLDIVGARFVREIEPGELVAIDGAGVRSERFAEARPKGCLFEYVYLARPDTTIAGRSVQATRVEVGRRLAREHPVEADMVIPTPESGTPAAIGYAEASGIPYGQGLVKNSYVGRTFIQPSQTIRQLGIRLKLNPLREAIEGKRLVVVDDSIVRGNTQRAIVAMLRDAGAAEVHVRISSPPVSWPCFYGIDFATRAELIAGHLSVEEIRDSIGADTLGYISLDELISASHIAKDRLCRACFDGVYPIAVDEDARGKHLLEVTR
ncbi:MULTISPECIES: amidophosphoribosyltransferase [Actinomadura]|uniref:Amidophosphoribosyltransferase n=1 Tax=Actinomadura madurae TaxID=1993 RepID=A0A1I5U8Q5_9ACTN|nr:amidophosphoribosyltransferase [Actinomadura madurae]MCP9951896.1 amidophosphoribosyltransferase [Actinomadura madurae]MCP9968665.1 amidophosphoribosyltransferase [Actinomadura madurae]MCP9981140.1 amidophosphoribosyltransferase [Actinomadura madurae]MCQ0007361.1 amidophosphoribosyltransferase [Actinomadura madurae]MCQ0017335.1 amidophosphoribosyltransferase [Actinomadura madurae]